MKKENVAKFLMYFAIVFLMICAYVVNRYKSKITETKGLPFYNTKIEAVEDGVYEGKCYTSFAHIQLKVEVLNHQIKDIQVIECDGLEAVKAKDCVKKMISENSIVIRAEKGQELGTMMFISCADDAITPEELKAIQ